MTDQCNDDPCWDWTGDLRLRPLPCHSRLGKAGRLGPLNLLHHGASCRRLLVRFLHACWTGRFFRCGCARGLRLPSSVCRSDVRYSCLLNIDFQAFNHRYDTVHQSLVLKLGRKWLRIRQKPRGRILTYQIRFQLRQRSALVAMASYIVRSLCSVPTLSGNFELFQVGISVLQKLWR